MLNQQQDLWGAIQGISRAAPMAWPVWLRLLLYAAVCLATLGLLCLVWLSSARQDVLDVQATHVRLRAEFSAKLLRAAPMTDLQSQHARLGLRLALLEKQLAAPHDMAILLADMSRAGRARNLRIELVRPAEMNRHLPYAQQLIALRVSGRYQDLADFTADLADLNWLISVHSFTLLPAKDGTLLMDAIIRTLQPSGMTPNESAAKASP
jgi:type IV pilus assembly protein PilO